MPRLRHLRAAPRRLQYAPGSPILTKFEISPALLFAREGLLRSWDVVDGRRKDMYMFSLIAADL